jgi:serine phosphatase RsbU (regulator of sigma subunit)
MNYKFGKDLRLTTYDLRLLLTFIVFSSSFIVTYAQPAKRPNYDSIVRKGADDSNKVNAYNALCKINIQKADYPKADSLGKLALDLGDKIGFKKGVAIAYRNIGNIFFAQGNYPEALNNQLKSLKIAEEIGNKVSVCNAYTNIGNIYGAEGNDPEALKNFLQSQKIAEKIGDKEDLARDYGNIGIIFEHEGGYTEAIKNQLKALKIDEEIGNKYGMGVIYESMGNICFLQGNYDEALKNLRQSVAITKDIGDNDGLCYSYESMGSIFIKQKKYAEAKQYLDSALKLSRESGDKELLKESYFNWATLDSSIHDFSAAYRDYKLLIAYRDSLNNEEATRKIVSQQLNFEFAKKQAIEKAEQDKKDAIAISDKNRQRAIIIAVSVVLVLLVVFSIILFSRFKITQRQKALIEAQKKVVEEQKQLVEQQKSLVEEKNKDITDSIHYASSIQRALFTTEEYIGKSLKEYFILFKPRDIVSGDFYWAYTLPDGSFYLACCDCTGHGVPGAFMSLLNISMLNESIIEKKITSPEMVLNDIRSRIIKALNPEGTDEEKDGMDCSLCLFDLDKLTLQAGCANNGLLIIKKDGSVVKIEPDKMPVGKQYGSQRSFDLKTAKLDKGDCIYMFTDGYADQFGGPKGKKFRIQQLEEKLLQIAGKAMKEQKKLLDQIFEDWRGEQSQIDDVLVIGVRV